MPHVNGSSDGDDLGDADEIKVFKHDEECEEEKKLIAEERQSDSLTEDKSSLVTEGESQVYHLFFLFHPPDSFCAFRRPCPFSQAVSLALFLSCIALKLEPRVFHFISLCDGHTI